jgi:hypothetical protein
MTRRELFAAPLAIPFIGNIFRPNPLTDIIRTLPYSLFPQYRPGDTIFWYEWPYWNVKLTGRVTEVRLESEYKFLVVHVDERSARKLIDKTRFPVWAVQFQPRQPYPKASVTIVSHR